jgi:hypothetical protein
MSSKTRWLGFGCYTFREDLLAGFIKGELDGKSTGIVTVLLEGGHTFKLSGNDATAFWSYVDGQLKPETYGTP